MKYRLVHAHSAQSPGDPLAVITARALQLTVEPAFAFAANVANVATAVNAADAADAATAATAANGANVPQARGNSSARYGMSAPRREQVMAAA